jgi:hypothetical protein
MDQNELMAFYTLLQLAPGKNQQAKLNFLQDLGLKVGGAAEPKQFVPEPQPTLTNPMDMYGSDPKVAAAFNLIQNGTDPITALKESGLPTMPNPLGGPNYLDIVTKFAQVDMENKAKLQDWQNQQAYKQQQMGPAPLGIKDISRSGLDVLNEQAGQPLTVESVLSAYKKSKAGMQPDQAGPPAPRQSSVRTGSSAYNKWLDEQAKNQIGMLLESARQKVVPTERGQALLSALQAAKAAG